MMKKIIIDKKMLEKKLAQVGKDEANLIELCIILSQTDSGNFNPSFLHIGAIHKDGTYVDLESIEEFPADLLIKRQHNPIYLLGGSCLKNMLHNNEIESAVNDSTSYNDWQRNSNDDIKRK